jgi:large subunit ribosomal protein L24
MRLISWLGCVSKLPKNYANFPSSYVRKQTEFVEFKTPKMANFQRKTLRWRHRPHFELHRPWSREFQDQNAPNTFQPKIYVQPFERQFIFRGDRVQILRGPDKGKQGLVNYVVPERNWVCVEGLNLRRNWRHNSTGDPIMLASQEAPLLIGRDVLLIDPQDSQPVQIEWRFDEEGRRVRVSARSERIIPIPSRAFETIDYKTPEAYVEQDKDTSAELVTQQTFECKLKTFEMDLMDEMGVKESRVPFPMYWY